MDLATLIGLVGALAVIVLAILVGGSAGTFFEPSSILIVVGGTVLATLIKFPLGHFLKALKVAIKAFLYKGDDPYELITESVELATIARKKGMLALEGVEVKNEFLKRGIQMLADGQEPGFVQRVLNRDINLTIERHERSESVFRAIGDVAPAMGMIGTLIGLVQMLSNMDDPKSIGPAMAVALLTTLYGAVIANVVALPIADKLAHRNTDERLSRLLILESIISIQEGLNPKVMEELLKTYLPAGQRDKAAA
ncbi:MAG: flagellar motor protein PomA [Candidatus Competibacteraceae bacterium]|nr:flagellar motor protein PomA [Candidatus Competibacteraceae bacterium]